MLDIIFIVIGVIIINTTNIIVCTKLSLYIINLSPNNITIEKNNTVINVNSIFLWLLNGILTLYKITKPVNPVNIADILDTWLWGIFILYDINATHNIFITIVKAPDSDLFIIFLKNPFFILLLLDSSAKKNEGIPIVNALIRVNCIGTNG